MRVLIADHQPHVRSALRLLLSQEPDVEVAGEASNLEETLVLVAVAAPDMVLLDWELPGNSGAAIARLRELHPGLTVIVLSAFPDARRMVVAAGADGFACKVSPPEQLLAVIQETRHSRLGI